MLSINPSELIWTVICFFVLLFLLKRFLYTPLIRHMDERRARVQEELDERCRADEALADNAHRLDGERERERQEAKSLLEKQRQDDDLRRAERVQQARQKAAEAEAAARKSAGELRQSAEAELEQRREALGVSLAEHLLGGAGERQTGAR